MMKNCNRKKYNNYRVKSISLYIQMEYCKNTLENYLNENPCEILTKEMFEKRMQIGYQIIRGINVLHESYKLVHGDLTLNSIHICPDDTVKIGDLGWVSECHESIEESQKTLKPMQRFSSFQELPIMIMSSTSTTTSSAPSCSR